MHNCFPNSTIFITPTYFNMKSSQLNQGHALHALSESSLSACLAYFTCVTASDVLKDKAASDLTD